MPDDSSSTSERPLLRRTLLAVLGVAAGLGLMVVLGGGDPKRESREGEEHTAHLPGASPTPSTPAGALPDRRALVAGGYTFDGRDLLVMVDLTEEGTFTIRSVRRRDGSSRRGSGRWSFVKGAPAKLRLRYEQRQGQAVDPKENQDEARLSRDALFLSTGGGEIRLERQERVRFD